MLCFLGHDAKRIGGSPHFSLLHDFCHGLLAGLEGGTQPSVRLSSAEPGLSDSASQRETDGATVGAEYRRPGTSSW